MSRASANASPARLIDAWSPSSFGARRVFSFDNILGALALLIRNPMVTVKLLDVLTLFGAGLAAYALGWSWYRRPLVATLTGLFFMASQASLTLGERPAERRDRHRACPGSCCSPGPVA